MGNRLVSHVPPGSGSGFGRAQGVPLITMDEMYLACPGSGPANRSIAADLLVREEQDEEEEDEEHNSDEDEDDGDEGYSE